MGPTRKPAIQATILPPDGTPANRGLRAWPPGSTGLCGDGSHDGTVGSAVGIVNASDCGHQRGCEVELAGAAIISSCRLTPTPGRRSIVASQGEIARSPAGRRRSSADGPTWRSPHYRPHVHAFYQDDVGVFAIESVELIGGELSRRQRRLVEAWAEIHQSCPRHGTGCRRAVCPVRLSHSARRECGWGTRSIRSRGSRSSARTGYGSSSPMVWFGPSTCGRSSKEADE